MADENDSTNKSPEEEVSEIEIKDEEAIEFDDYDKETDEPIDYVIKTIEEEEEIKEDFLENRVNDTIYFLNGKSRLVVSTSLLIFIICILNFIAWNFTGLKTLEYVGMLLSILLLISCTLGIMISYNVYNIS